MTPEAAVPDDRLAAAALAGLPDAACLAQETPDGLLAVTWANAAWQTLGADAAVGVCPLAALCPEAPDEAREAVRQAVAHRTPLALLIGDGPPGDGTRWFDWRGTPLDTHPGGWILVVHDVTDRRRLEAQLQQAAKLEAVGRLSGGLAHDFNNLLTGILGFTELLLHSLPEADPRHRDAAEIRRAAQRASALTRQLLAFGRVQHPAPQLLDLNAVVREASRLLQRLLGEDVELVTVTSPLLGRVHADAGQLEQVIVNLAVNARDAMPNGGRLELETHDLTLDATAARTLGCAPGPWVQLAVRDTGTGMPPEVAAKVFEPFFTTKTLGQGTGLGLAMVDGIIRRAGGRIALESRVGEGTVFRILLPRAADPARPGTPLPSTAAPAAGGRETILLVEDEATVRVLAQKVLERLGYAVLVAASLQEALDLDTRHGRADLLLTDVIMPGGSGLQLAELYRRRHADVPVLYMSGYADTVLAGTDLRATRSAFLAKPFSPDALGIAVRQLLDAAAGASDLQTV